MSSCKVRPYLTKYGVHSKVGTPFWSSGTYHGVNFEVIKSGRKNQLESTIQEMVSMESPIASGTSFTPTPSKLLKLSTNTYDSKNVISYDTACAVNPYLIGIWGNYRPSNTYVYYKDRNYTGHNRTEGKFDINSGDNFWSIQSLQCNSNLVPQGMNSPNYKRTSNEIWYTSWGVEIQNTNPLDIKSAAQYSYGKQLPVAVCTNVTQSAFMYDGFEDYNILTPWNNMYASSLDYKNSIFKETTYSSLQSIPTQLPYHHYVFNTGLSLEQVAHSGKYSIKTTNPLSLAIPVNNAALNVSNTAFAMLPQTKYIFSLWVKGASNLNITLQIGANPVQNVSPSSEVIDGWVKYEGTISPCPSGNTVTLGIPSNVNVDDIRLFPSNSNMKSFVYDEFSLRLMATLDENNYASFYEYDQEGILLRTKKETEKGILTIQENRSSNKKN